ncbi:NUDIX domain-containing protein [Oleiagrimonas sp. MCCC 1A03011]|uniref:NUDIX hydrolase n=1 Tax=Oleiagrimonas sp. MCCC 1A03011 TaxID=1926883 RepID=UPI000DC60C71|nr:NUDIX domain-containing protein [Oleiagrimonas sp. MCCC 1A03011]RAP57413.1 NUDIX hydrolase [Oleiagrimonas sp. MCCC 1A03011]
MSADLIRTVAAVIANDAGEVLLVRKRASDTFIQPGGKIEPGEAWLETLARELEEELGVRLDPATAVHLGEFEERAVHEPGRRVRAQAFHVSVVGTPSPQAEIEAMAWVDPQGPRDVRVAPLSAGHILPAFVAWRRTA